MKINSWLADVDWKKTAPESLQTACFHAQLSTPSLEPTPQLLIEHMMVEGGGHVDEIP